MHSTIKVVDRKNDLRTLGDSLELKNAAENKASNIVEVDLSFNQLDNIEALDVFPSLKILLLDHNNLTSLQSFPSLPRLETLSLSYNGIRGQDNLLINLSQKFPALKNLNLMKNPVNPMFDSEEKYAEFRATVKIWIPTLQTLDGTDFSQNMDDIRKKQKEVEAQKSQALKSAGGSKKALETIPEERKEWKGGASGQKNVAQEDILSDLKKKKQGASAAGGSTYQFNQRAYKKYHSTRSLVERILKSHSEGNRFIRNEDL
ncbi:hypothetical protein FGO68_gene2488 [Halteria grandinella]|uniref:Uncharacterized protein n=1 Tax=Halteria grandinella TaxID=5974 RepID=A0A8J8T3Q9_HALGN|nr:hypothetical protein FGO68_gene2488 [Halteria grandinella]